MERCATSPSMPTRPRLSENQRCMVNAQRPTDRYKRLYLGDVAEVLPKGYMIRVDGFEGLVKYNERAVKPMGRAPSKASSLKVDPQHQRPSVVAAARRVVVPIVKPEPPEKCEAWLKYVRTLPCCNCGVVGYTEAHHEGKKGVSQKVRDTLAVPLCAHDHIVYTSTNRLPKPGGGIDLRTREESLRILQAEQDRLLTAALEKLERPARIEVLSKAMARVGVASKGALHG